MHELGVAMQVIDIVSKKCAGARVKRVVVHVGALAAILPDSLSFCFDLAIAGTPLEGAVLEIVERPGRALCRRCEQEFDLWRPFGTCECGNSELDWLGGNELRIHEMEVA